MDYYFNQLMEIQNSTDHSFFLLDQDSEPRFVIEADKRTIIIPAEFQFLGVKTDQRSEKIYFEVDRIFDDVDLSTKTCVIQYINAGTDDVDEGIYPVTELDTTTVPGKIVFKWEVDNIVCKYAGVVAFSVRFYEIDPETKLYTYCWNTIPENLPVLDGLNVSGSVTEDFPTELLEWNARMAALNTEITNKISTADATMKADLKTAKGYMDGAQAARKGAEEAESRVNKIVAGNEAYTKVESDTMYAKSQVKESERGTSVEVYPEDGSNLAVTAYGFTKQTGTGDPSPTNVRVLTNGGTDNYFVPEMLAPEVTWDAETKTLTKPSSTGIYYDIFNGTTGLNTVATNYIQLLPNTKYVFSAGACDTATEVFVVANDGTVSKITGNLANASIEAETGETGKITIRMYATGKSKAANLSIKKYNTEEIFGYVVSKSGINGVTFLPLTAPLCEGDSVVSYTKSGCDMKVVLDGGVADGFTYLSQNASGSVWRILVKIPNVIDYNKGGFGFSDWVNYKIGWGSTEESFYCTDGGVFLFIKASSLEEAKSVLSQKPLTMWLRSASYTEAADKPVSLETHQQAVLVLDGTEGWATAVAGAYYMFPSNLPKASSAASTTSAVSDYLTAAPTNDIAAGTEGFGVGPSGSIAVRLPNGAAPSAYMPDKPLTIVYQLANPITYAHPAVDIISNISESGNIVVSGQKEVSVSYHKSLDKTIIELDNKSYSKQESDNIFAKALRGTAEAAKSITIYPDKGSNVVATINGFTKQEGSGDASTMNVRPIVNGGNGVNLINVPDGSGYASGSTLKWEVKNGVMRFYGTKSKTDALWAYATKQPCDLPAGDYTAAFKVSANGNWKIIFYDESGEAVLTMDKPVSNTRVNFTLEKTAKMFTLNQYLYNSDLTTVYDVSFIPCILRGHDNKENETPYIDAQYGVAIAIKGQPNANRCLKLTAPLCQGDTLITKVKSGCDKVLVLDGSQACDTVTVLRNVVRLNVRAGLSSFSEIPLSYSDRLPIVHDYNLDTPHFYIRSSDGFVQCFLSKEWLETYDNAGVQKYFSANPLTVWYRSANYTPAADIAAALETHQQAVLVLDGTEGWTWNKSEHENGIYRGVLRNVSPQGKNGFPVCSHAKPQTTFTNTNGVTAEGGTFTLAFPNIQTESGLTDFKAYLAAQYAAGTPVTIVYELATPLVYAHEPVDFIASPDEEGAWVITGEADGTVSAEYNKDITYAFNELQSAVLAAIAKLSL